MVVVVLMETCASTPTVTETVVVPVLCPNSAGAHKIAPARMFFSVAFMRFLSSDVFELKRDDAYAQNQTPHADGTFLH